MKLIDADETVERLSGKVPIPIIGLIAKAVIQVLNAAPTVRCGECDKQDIIRMHTDGPRYPACLCQGNSGVYAPAPDDYGCGHFERRTP